MREERLFEAIGLVDDDLVEEAADARRTAVPWRHVTALAACLVLVLGIGSFILNFRGCSSKAPMSRDECAVEAPRPPEMAEAELLPEKPGAEPEAPAVPEPEEDLLTEDAPEGKPEAPAAELPSVAVRIEAWEEDPNYRTRLRPRPP